jgi:type IV secretory system conjugative DNA transfer VirD4/TraG family protein
MDTLSQIEVYRQLPLESVVRHEAGHSVMAHCCGGSVQRVIFGRKIFGGNYGRSFWAVPDLDKYLLVLSAGVLALYLHERPSGTAFQSFIEWVSTTDGYILAISGASDWSEILRLTEQPRGYGMDDFLERAVRPYCDEAVGLLANARDQLDGLTEVILAQPPGLGHRSLKRFFAGNRRNRLADWLDRGLRYDEQIVLIQNAPPPRCGRAIYFRRPDMLARVKGTGRDHAVNRP